MDLKIKNKKLTKKLKSRNDSTIERKVYPKDSFDRFGDDLCEELLSYQTIGNKLRFECICKQWQRLLFNKHKTLVITEYSKLVLNQHFKQKLKEYQGFDDDFDCIQIQNYFWLTNKTNILRQLCQKFRFVTDLRIKGFKVDNKSIEILSQNCNHLTVIDIRLDSDIKVENYERFATKFGQTLKSIRIIDIENKYLELLLKYCPNLETIYLFNSLDVLSKHFLPKLQEIHCLKDSDFKSFADKYKTQIRKLRFDLFLYSDDLPNIRRTLLVSQFLKLQELHLRLSRTEEFSPKCLQSIASECKQLRLLSLSVCSLTFERRLFENLSKFDFLENLSLILYEYVSDINDNNVIENTQHLKICSKIKYFTLNTIGLSDNDLIVIFECFPNLITFSLNCRYDGLNITDKTLDNLLKLQKLSTLCMKTHKYFPFITDSSVEKFMRRCLTIENISIRYKLDSIKTFDPLIERANKNPKNVYKFDFYVKSLEKYLENKSNLLIGNNLKLFAFHKPKRQDFICSTSQIWRLDSDYDKLKYSLLFY